VEVPKWSNGSVCKTVVREFESHLPLHIETYSSRSINANSYQSLSEYVSIWSYSISASMAPCHGAETGSIPVGTAKVCLVRIMDNTGDFYSLNVGSIPARGAKMLDIVVLLIYNCIMRVW